MKVTFLGLEFNMRNLGCEALAYSFAGELDSVFKQLGIKGDYTAVVFAAKEGIVIPGSDSKVKCLRIKYKSFGFWRDLLRLFKESDYIVDFTGGDSFSDIYGKKRFYLATIIKYLACKAKATFILGPQTYGPFKDKKVLRLAQKVLRMSDYVFARDDVSQKYASDISGRDVHLTSDVAFTLQYDPSNWEKDTNKIHVGFNASGLLWNGGYESAKLSLSVEYMEYCDSVIKQLSNDSKYCVHLITHVGDVDLSIGENDYKVCKELHEKYPNTVLVEPFQTPMEAKSYISGLDVFIGARMHATIASFSSGIATIPTSYSRKFEGLYGNLGYSSIIQLCSDTTDGAIEKTIEYVNNYKQLTENVVKSKDRLGKLQAEFRNDLIEIIKEGK